MLYTAKLTEIDYKREGPNPHVRDVVATLPLVATIRFDTDVRGLPVASERYLFSSLDELAERAESRLAELEKKGQLFLAIRETLKERNIELAELRSAAKPAPIEDSTVAWPVETDETPAQDPNTFADTAIAPA